MYLHSKKPHFYQLSLLIDECLEQHLMTSYPEIMTVRILTFYYKDILNFFLESPKN